MRIFHPQGGRQIAARNRLLQRALRPEPAPFAIEREYPLVLGDGQERYSYCLGDGDSVVAHANLWPRTLIDNMRGRELKIGLVGNVATDERFRGQGAMRTLLDALKQEAGRQDLKALVLWSDLLGFYQKLGFQSFGQEQRWRFLARRLQEAGIGPGPFARVVTRAAPPLAAAMLAVRQPVASTLVRSEAEFQALLAIPALDVFLARKDRDAAPTGYALLGKGVDMVGVIHEWGAETPTALLEAVSAAAATGFDEIVVLTPATLPADWQAELGRYAAGMEPHPLGLAWTPPGAASAEVQAVLGGSFIWGLDSI